MSPEQAAEKKEQALRDSQLDLFYRLQGALVEVSDEMLGNKQWRTDRVDRHLQELLEDIQEHFGIEQED